MDVLRTPDARFEGLPDFPFPPHHVDVGGARMHHVDEGRGDPVLMLHGEPTWGYLYRRMIPPLAREHRVVVPDLLGFGRSDKPARVEDHTMALHVGSVVRLVEKLDLTDVTLVCQDWGGLIGLSAVAEVPDRFARLVVMNTGLPDGTQTMPEAWWRFRDFVAETEDLPVGFIVSRGCARDLPEDAWAAYDAPFPGPEFKAGPRALPLMVPVREDMDAVPFIRRARAALRGWEKPCLVAFSDQDPITRGGDAWFRKHVPGAAREPDVVVRGGGHFLQEDEGEQIAEHVAAFVKRNPL